MSECVLEYGSLTKADAEFDVVERAGIGQEISRGLQIASVHRDNKRSLRRVLAVQSVVWNCSRIRLPFGSSSVLVGRNLLLYYRVSTISEEQITVLRKIAGII